jgi:hypothetical protein
LQLGGHFESWYVLETRKNKYLSEVKEIQNIYKMMDKIEEL